MDENGASHSSFIQMQRAQVCAVSKSHFTQNLPPPLRPVVELFTRRGLPVFTDTPGAVALDAGEVSSQRHPASA